MSTATVTEQDRGQQIVLTKREREVFSEIIQVKPSHQVAEDLCCSKRTVDFHLASIYEKLGVSNRVQAFRHATRLGLIDVDLSADKN